MTDINELFKTPRKPIKVVDCDALTNDEWLVVRRLNYNNLKNRDIDETILNKLEITKNLDKVPYFSTSIGGSDSSSILGTSHWRTGLELYYDKAEGKVEENIDRGRQYIFDFGHAMEAFVAEHYEKVFKEEFKDNVEREFSLHYGEPILIKDCRVYRDTWMYKNPEYPFMSADLDFKIDLILEDDRVITGIFECKTTSPFTIKDNWEFEAPAYYQCQTRHYMAVMDYPFTIIACAADNSANNYYSHIIFRDAEKEKELIEAECKFAQCVEDKNPPYDSKVNNLECILDHMNVKKQDETVDSSDYCKDAVERILALDNQISMYNNGLKDLKSARELILSNILTYMQEHGKCNMKIETELSDYVFKVEAKTSNALDYNKFWKLCKKLPDGYDAVIENYKSQCLKSTEVKNTLSAKAHKHKESKKEVA